MASAGRKRVLIIVQNLPVPFDRRVWLEALTLRDAGYLVSIISPKGQHGKYQESHQFLEGIQIYRYPAPPEGEGVLAYVREFLYCWIYTALLSVKVWWRHGFDAIHACNPPETYFFLAWFYKLLGKKFLFDHHDLSPEMYLAKGGTEGGLLHRGLLLLEWLTFKTADVVVTTNESHKDVAMQRGGVAEERVFIVRTGPDFDRLQQLDVEEPLKKGKPYLVCYLGEMCEQDGVDYVLKSAKLLQEQFQRDDVQFILMGGGPALSQLREMKTVMGLDEFVDFTGRVSDYDLCRYLSTADVCLDPDPFTEWSNQSTMNKIMEYMAFGKPTVAFNLKENRYSAQEAAVYAQANDVNEFTHLLVDLLDTPQKRAEMGEFGQKRVHTKLAWDYSKPFLIEAYKKLFK